jgi:hypothetical protein
MADINKPLYPIGTALKHKQRGSIHVITGLPDTHRVEDGWKPAYQYTCGSITTMREQSEMEDGRFERIDLQEVNPPCVTVIGPYGMHEYHRDRVMFYPRGASGKLLKARKIRDIALS